MVRHIAYTFKLTCRHNMTNAIQETGPAKLAPIVDAATLALFQQEIDRLKAENATLREKAATASTSPSTIVQQPVQGDSANATDVVALREKLAAVEAVCVVLSRVLYPF